MTRATAFIFNRGARQGGNADWLSANRQAVEAVAAGGPISVVANPAELGAAIDEALQAGCASIV
ncbi:MAG: hypothetical protein M3O01_07275, partial [Pseudomonadota bacterium]|nr:hypothetical protein [Pseudomonadota bacterium]